MKFTSTFLFFASLAVSGLATDVGQVQADITTIGEQLTKLGSTIDAFPTPGGTLSQGLAIHNTAGKLITTLNTATTNAEGLTPRPISDEDGRAILDHVLTLESSITGSLTAIQSKKSGFAALPVGNLVLLVRQDLVKLNASTFAFEHALLDASPASVQEEAAAFGSRIDAAFGEAIASYGA